MNAALPPCSRIESQRISAIMQVKIVLSSEVVDVHGEPFGCQFDGEFNLCSFVEVHNEKVFVLVAVVLSAIYIAAGWKSRAGNMSHPSVAPPCGKVLHAVPEVEGQQEHFFHGIIIMKKDFKSISEN